MELKKSVLQTDQGSFCVSHIVAIAHSIILTIYHILLNKDHFCDFVSEYFNAIYADKIKQRSIRFLEKSRFSVSLS